jgi:hypothetical protein
LFKQHFALLEDLTARIDDTEKRIGELVKDDDTVKTRLACQPCIGLVSAVTMRAMIGQFDRFRNGKQFAHFCAVSPRNDSTAVKTTTGGLVKTGDPMLRVVLMEAAHRLIRDDKHWQEMAEQLKKKGETNVCRCCRHCEPLVAEQMTVGENRPVHSGNTAQGISMNEQESTPPQDSRLKSFLRDKDTFETDNRFIRKEKEISIDPKWVGKLGTNMGKLLAMLAYSWGSRLFSLEPANLG